MSHQQALCMEPVQYTSPEGKTYTLKLIDFEGETKFAYAKYAEALKRIEITAKIASEFDEDAARDRAEHEFVMGHFGILSTDGCRWITSAPGRITLFQICTDCSEAEARDVCLSDPEGVGKALDATLSHSFPGLEKRWDALKKKKPGPKD